MSLFSDMTTSKIFLKKVHLLLVLENIPCWSLAIGETLQECQILASKT